MDKYPLKIYGPDFCRNCNRKSIELFDYWNNPMRYHDMVKDYLEFKPNRFTILNNKTVYKLRCRSCGKNYAIRWDRGYPVPDLYNENKNNNFFMSKYIDIVNEDNPVTRVKSKLNKETI